MREDVIFVTSYSVPDKLESNLSPRSSPFAKGEADCKAQRVTASQLSFFDADQAVAPWCLIARRTALRDSPLPGWVRMKVRGHLLA